METPLMICYDALDSICRLTTLRSLRNQWSSCWLTETIYFDCCSIFIFILLTFFMHTQLTLHFKREKFRTHIRKLTTEALFKHKRMASLQLYNNSTSTS
jgi:hypothetical protein